MSCNNVEVVSKKLISIGLSEKKDFFEYFIWQEYYYPIFMWYYSGKIVIKYVDLSVTQCCNLRCKDCSILTPYVKQPKHRKIEDLQADVDILFKNIDRLETLYIIGGEPLLYPNLCKICDYIAVNYSNCISRLKIATNALIDLSEDMIKTFQKSRIEIQISDYSESVYGANKRINIFCQKLDDNNIKYYRMTDAVWCDYGFRNQCTYRTDEKMRSFFDECKIDCRGLEDAKFYYCFPTQMITKLDGFNNEEDLYLDLKHTTKEEIFEFNLGYSDKGFMNICRKCNGSYRNNKKYIDVALQLTNEEDK
jgi:MoaA/NifB/PqqE/SkfB family radical SAM enzyme